MQGIIRAAKHFALVALLLRALVPAGWMPDAQAGITICSTTLGMIHHDGAPGGADHRNAHEECPFAAAPHLAKTPDLAAIAIPSPRVLKTAPPAPAPRPEQLAAYRAQSPRAPPQHA